MDKRTLEDAIYAATSRPGYSSSLRTENPQAAFNLALFILDRDQVLTKDVAGLAIKLRNGSEIVCSSLKTIEAR